MRRANDISQSTNFIPSPQVNIHVDHNYGSHHAADAASLFSTVGLDDGTAISVGTVLGTVADEEVRSPFTGVLQSYIAVDTERVAARQPIAWLRTN